MPTRRELLLSMVSVPFAGSFLRSTPARTRVDANIFAEPHWLAQESAMGFRLLLSRNDSLPVDLLILPGIRHLSRDAAVQLLERVSSGSWLILELGFAFVSQKKVGPQLRMLRDVFGFAVQLPIRHMGRYIEYTWPARALVRDFNTITPIDCPPANAIATCNGTTVGARRATGKGGVILLGSMLGPGLFADEREAHEVGNAMLRAI